jgi:hypothetical protein
VRRLLLALGLCVCLTGLAAAGSVVMVEKRQSTGVGYPLETTRAVKLPSGQIAQLVTCCGLNQDDSAIYTLRDTDGYTLVDRKFTSGRFFLSPEGRIISVQKNGPAFTITFQDHQLRVIKQINLVNVHSLAPGERGSIAVQIKQAESTVLRIYDSGGQVRWETGNRPPGTLFFLPNETHLAFTDERRLSLFPLPEGSVQSFEAPGRVQFIGAEPAKKLVFLAMDLSSGPEVWALDQASLTPKWKHRLVDTPAGHCQNMVVDLSRYIPTHKVIALILRCQGERQAFHVVRFLTDAGQMIGQEKLGRRIETTFYEVKNTIAIVSDGYVYSFAVRE